jgi:uncharacterized membrane protein
VSSGPSGPLGVHLDQRQRLLIAVPAGVVLGILLAVWFPWQLGVLGGWDLAALTIAGSIWSFIPRLDPEQTRRVATREDDSRAVVDVIMVAASLVSLVGVVLGLAEARNHKGALAAALTALAVFTVFLSWFTVHTLFVLRYAHLYYGDPVGGIEFAGDDGTDPQPDYLDFAYVAFTVGMTFQVSDTGIGQRRIRRAVIRHALLSYLFGTVIVGVAINVVGGWIS